ncbi:MAG: 50S ribosomal protein L3 [Patescibacteria group bacterium]
MKHILGYKDGMTQIFDETGAAVPVTVINIPQNTVTDIKTLKRDGYSAIQLGVGERTLKRITKAVRGHLAKSNRDSAQDIREFRGDFELAIGDSFGVDVFEIGDELIVSSTSKGKGFQGGVKRHNFSGGRRSHGNKHAEREVGSIGDTGIQRVMRGKKMPGRMGSDRITIKNLPVVMVDTEHSRILIKGSVAGKRGDLVELRTTR